MSDPAHPSIHANAVVVGEAGVLIRGPSGAGKSSLSIALVDEARSRGAWAALVADDRVYLGAEHGRLVGRGAPGFEGLVERRGEGLIRLDHEPFTVLRLVVDLAPRNVGAPRWPADDVQTAELLGVALPALILDFGMGVLFAARLILGKLASDSPGNVRQRRIPLDHRAALHKNVSGA